MLLESLTIPLSNVVNLGTIHKHFYWAPKSKKGALKIFDFRNGALKKNSSEN